MFGNHLLAEEVRTDAKPPLYTTHAQYCLATTQGSALQCAFRAAEHLHHSESMMSQRGGGSPTLFSPRKRGSRAALRLAINTRTPHSLQIVSWVRPNRNVDYDLFDFSRGRFSFSLRLSFSPSFSRAFFNVRNPSIFVSLSLLRLLFPLQLQKTPPPYPRQEIY